VSGADTLPELERLFAGRPADPHLEAARALLGALARELPEAGLAVTGSVAQLAHRADSDLDLVVADRAFGRDAQFTTEYGGVRAAIVCLRPSLTAEREQRWSMLAGGDAAVASMVRGAHLVRDPAGAFVELRETVSRTDALRLAHHEALRARYRQEVEKLARAARDAGAQAAPVLVRLLGILLDAWCLERGVVRTSKRQRLLEEVSARDPELFALLQAALPVTPAALEPLTRAAGLIEGLRNSTVI
jgi:hypothetical protein